jgi:hypothetical protein
MMTGLGEVEQWPLSSPPSSSLENGSSKTKIKRPAPVTPNSFRRFFAPRTSLSKDKGKASRSRRALEDVTLPSQLPSPDESPARSSPCKRFRVSPPAEGFTIFDETEDLIGPTTEDDSDESGIEQDSPSRYIQRCQESFLATQIFHQSMGGRCGPKYSSPSEIRPGMFQDQYIAVMMLTIIRLAKRD